MGLLYLLYLNIPRLLVICLAADLKIIIGVPLDANDTIPDAGKSQGVLILHGFSV
jgi:hypothetical protein